MTISDVVNQLTVHFLEEDRFSLDQLSALVFDKTIPAADRALFVTTALTDMEKSDMIRRVGNTWYLTRPMGAIHNDVSLSISTCVLIKDTIESFHKAQGHKFEPVNPFEIHEGHMLHVLEILGNVLDNPPAD